MRAGVHVLHPGAYSRLWCLQTALGQHMTQVASYQASVAPAAGADMGLELNSRPSRGAASKRQRVWDPNG